MGISIENMKRTLVKTPKSLIFAQYVDALRLASSNNEQKLDEALLIANKGVEANPGFLPGKLARGRVLLEKEDLVGAKIDFEAVAKRDPFCVSAHKLLLETAEKLGQPLQTDIYAKILSTLEPGYAAPVAQTTPSPKTQAAPSPEAQTALSSALDDILEEDEKDEKETETRLLKAVDSIIESASLQQLPEATSMFDKEPPPAASELPIESSATSIDDILKEQLADKPVENLPDLTGDMDTLLASTLDTEPKPEPEPEPQAAKDSAPQIDDILKEQLADKPVENLPDLTGDMDTLLASTLDTEPKPEPEPEPEPQIAKDSAPQIDDILKEQLADKPVENLPDLTGDMDTLLASTLDTEPKPEPEPEPQAAKDSTPQIDDILKEQLADKPVENLPDLTGDMDTLLASTLDTEPKPEPEPEPQAAKGFAPQIDDILKEQLADKPVENLPDLTGDMDTLLASTLDTEPKPEPEPELQVAKNSAPQIDDILKEQLADKPVGNIPDLTGDMDALLVEKETLTQSPTETLAEIYMSQGLPQKATAVYKELLARDPGNDELKAKLDLAETQVI